MKKLWIAFVLICLIPIYSWAGPPVPIWIPWFKTQRYYPATLSDTTSPHQLTIRECSDTVITTQGWNGTDDITFNLPDISSYNGTEGVLKVQFRDVVGMQDSDTDMHVDPDGSTQIDCNGTITGTDGHSIVADNISIYTILVCTSDYDATLGGFWHCINVQGTTFQDNGS